MNKTSTGLTESVASALCYVGLFVTGIIFLVIEQENKVVRFNAMQSLITFGALSVVGIIAGIIAGILKWIPFIGGLLGGLLTGVVSLCVVCLALYLIVKNFVGDNTAKLPIVGDICWEQVNK